MMSYLRVAFLRTKVLLSHVLFRESKEEWIKAKYVEKTYFCWRKCVGKIPLHDEHILRALNKIPGHHVGDVKRPTKKKLGRRRPNLTSSIFKRFSKSEKKNSEALKTMEKTREEKAGQSSATTSPELSPEINRSGVRTMKSPIISRYIYTVFTCLNCQVAAGK